MDHSNNLRHNFSPGMDGQEGEEMKNIKRMALGFTTGLITGMFCCYGLNVWMSRSGTVGGEVMIFPLILLLLYFGYSIGRESKTAGKWRNTYKKGYQRGYADGLMEGKESVIVFHPNYRHSIKPIQDRTGQ